MVETVEVVLGTVLAVVCARLPGVGGTATRGRKVWGGFELAKVGPAAAVGAPAAGVGTLAV